VGQRKCEAFGEEFLTVIRDYGTAHPEAKAAGPDETPGSEEAASPVFTSRSRADRDGSQRRADELFAQGRSVEEAAEALGRRPSTVEGYLVQYIRKHRITDASLWVDPAVVQRVAEAAAATGVERLKPIYEFLNGEVSYAAIRICLACVRNGAS
jgi:ATP-dependent DNA helicase RecQ